MEQVELTIIGGGPVGLFAAYYARLRNLNVRVIESLATVGGQITALYPQKKILDVAGMPKILGHTLVTQLMTQATQLNPQIVTNTTVTDVIANANGFEIVTTAGSFQSGTVIVATGRGSFQPRTLPLPDLPTNVQAHVHYFVGDGNQFTGKDVLIAGGGDAAVDAALQLIPSAKQVYLMHRRAQFRAFEHSVSQLAVSDVKLVVPYLISDLTSQPDGKILVTMQAVMGNQVQELVVDEVLVSYGFISENITMAGWHVQPTGDHRGIMVDQTLQTSVPGLFAIGDAAIYDGRSELLSTGFGEAPLAVNAALKMLQPTSRGPIHSSSLKITDGHVVKE